MKQATLAIMTAPQQHCCLPNYTLSSHWQTRPRDAVSTKLQAQLTLTDPPAWRCVYQTTSSAQTDRPARVTLCLPHYKLSYHWQTRPRDAVSTELQAQLSLTDPPAWRCVHQTTSSAHTDRPTWRCVYQTTSSAHTDRPARVTQCWWIIHTYTSHVSLSSSLSNCHILFRYLHTRIVLVSQLLHSQHAMLRVIFVNKLWVSSTDFHTTTTGP